MKHSLTLIVTLTLFSGALFASGKQPPSTHLQKGEWAYHSVVKITSGIMSGRTMKKDWKACVKNERDAARSLMPHTKAGNTTCSKPTLSYSKKGYHTVMSCVTKGRGIVSKLHEDFLLKAGDKGETFKAHGKVEQKLMVGSTPARKMHMIIDIHGQHTGECQAKS